MAKIRPHNSNDQRPVQWHTKVWDFIEQHSGVAEEYEATGRPGPGGPILDKTHMSAYGQAVVNEAERRASE